MAGGYVKPGVEVSQSLRSITPTLSAPDLTACIVGHAYYIVSPNDDEALLYNNGSPLEYTAGTSPGAISLSGVNSTYYDVSGDTALVTVDLLGITGTDTGKKIHLSNGAHFTAVEGSPTVVDGITLYQSTITISGVISLCTTGNKYYVYVGYRAKKYDAFGFKTIDSFSTITETLGKSVTYNPLSYGAYLAMLNSVTSLNTLGVSDYSVKTSVLTDINDKLENREVYVIAPMIHDVALDEGLSIHCTTQSLPENKKERVAFFCNEMPNTTASGLSLLSSSLKTNIANEIQEMNSAYKNRRIVSIHPDIAYISENRHISTIKQSWLDASFKPFQSSDTKFQTLDIFAKFQSATIINNVKYLAGTNITDTVWTAIKDYISNGMIQVLVPVPGFYYAAVNAGLAIGSAIEQPLTNFPSAGIARVAGSNEIFTETQLNIMAAGGTWIEVQDNPNSSVYCRHQMTTDFTSVTAREFSITKAVDYVAKYVRNALKPYIGRYNITPELLEILSSKVRYLGSLLIKQGVIESFSAGSFIQDTTNPDTLTVDINIKPKYPVNYIKVTIIF